eukprot:TRINITY_DN2695_c0_g1_i2.p1 TRINITY_DN2695_c0_g1~~TRINITY_DN2695_c0_g1_i2.p1  ORF type:complete len:323 (-),score=28.54 TRINITY_DN2695_c0_g1_i2:81-1049(-)
MSDIRRRKPSKERNGDEFLELSGNEIPKRATINVIQVSTFLTLVVGTTFGCFLGGPWSQPVVDYLRGYRWDYNKRCINESPDSHGYGVDFCRIPADCSFCSDVHEIDEFHVSEISHHNFSKRYAHTNRPLVVRNASSHWKAMTDFNYYWLKEQYTRDPETLSSQEDGCWFNRYKTFELINLAAVFRLPDSRVRMEPGEDPWYVGFAVCPPSVADAVHQLIEQPKFIPEYLPLSTPYVFIGTPGPGAHPHVDHLTLPNWQAQISGEKKWTLTAPPECYWTCGNKPLEKIVYPGDIIVVNINYWFHSTQILGDQLSLVITNVIN